MPIFFQHRGGWLLRALTALMPPTVRLGRLGLQVQSDGNRGTLGVLLATRRRPQGCGLLRYLGRFNPVFAQQPKHWSGELPAMTLFVKVNGWSCMYSPPPCRVVPGPPLRELPVTVLFTSASGLP